MNSPVILIISNYPSENKIVFNIFFIVTTKISNWFLSNLKIISSLLYMEHELETICKNQNIGHRITNKIKSVKNILYFLSDQFLITQNTNEITLYLYEKKRILLKERNTIC